MIEWFEANKLVPYLDKNKYNEICNRKFTTARFDYWLQREVHKTNSTYKISWLATR